MKLILYFFLVFFHAQTICAQQPASIHLTEENSLPDIEFYNITEDSKNYIWLAADKGLYRYNGNNFEYYSHPKQKGNAVFGTKEDQLGRVWCNNVSGQFLFTENNELKLFIDLGDLLNGVLTEFIVTQEELIVLTGGNIIRVDLKTKEVKKDFDESVFIGAMKKTSKGYLFTKGNVLINSNKSLKTIDSLEIDVFDNYSIDSGIANRVLVSSNSKINLFHFLRFGKNEFYGFNFSKSTYDSIKIPLELERRQIIQTFFHKNNIWFSTDSGIYVCELKDNALLLRDVYFKDKFITKVIEDSDANYWIITKGDGIYVIPNINIFQHQYKKEDLNITKLEKLKRHLFVFGTADGKIGSFNSKASKFTILDTNSVYRVSEIKRLAKSNQTLIIKEDLVYKMNNLSLNYRKVDALQLQGAKSLSEIRNNFYIVSSYKRAKLVNSEYKLQKILVDKRSYTNYYSKNSDKTYISTVEGFYVFDNTFGSRKISFNGKLILAKDIVETVNQKIWVSTFNDGIFCISGDKVINHFNTDNGLLSHRISTIKNDGNHLWVSTDEGIQYLNTVNNEFKNLTKQNGIPSYRISDIEIDEEKVFFANNTGIFSLDKNKVFKIKKVPKVYISDISIGLKSTELKSHYELAHNKNSIKISFNANGFNSFINNKYQFRLIGQDDTWQTDENKSNTVSYYSLPSGEYTFQVKSILADSDDTDAISFVSFNINKPFWAHWWFYGVIIFIVAVILYFIFTNKIKKLKKEQSDILQKEQVNRQLVLSQLENLRSQMNPHFIFNALNSIQEYIVFNEKDLASSYLIKFSRLIRIYLEHSRENEVLLSEELKALTIYLDLEKNRFEDVLDYKITVSKDLDVNKIKIPSFFIQPYAENALKHGLLHKKDYRELFIDFSINNSKDILYCKVQDNGIGMEASRALNSERNPMHKSFATSANKRRVDLLNTNRTDKIKVEINSLSEGTEVLITIPFN